MQEMQVPSMVWEDPLEEMATHSSILVWEISWTEKSGRLQSIELQRVRHDWISEHTGKHVQLFMLQYLYSTSGQKTCVMQKLVPFFMSLNFFLGDPRLLVVLVVLA